MDLGGPGAVRGDRPRRPPSTLETEGVLDPGRAEVGGAEPVNCSHRPGRGRPRGWGRGREHRAAARGGQRRESRREGRPGAGAGSHPPASLSLSTRPSSPSTRTRSADRRSWVEVSGGNRSQAVAEVPRVPPPPCAHLPGPGAGSPGPRASAPSSPPRPSHRPPLIVPKAGLAPGCAHPQPALP